MYRRMEFLKGECKYPDLKICCLFSESSKEANIPGAQYARDKEFRVGDKSGGRRKVIWGYKGLGKDFVSCSTCYWKS